MNGNVVTLKQYAETHGLDYDALRRHARRGNVDGAFKFGKTWGIPANAPVPTLPESSSRAVRKDGRKRFTVWCNDAEYDAVVGIVGADNVVDPRAVAREKRAARNAAKNDND